VFPPDRCHSEGKADEAVAPVNEPAIEPAPAVTILPRQDKVPAAAGTPAARPATDRPQVQAAGQATPAAAGKPQVQAAGQATPAAPGKPQTQPAGQATPAAAGKPQTQPAGQATPAAAGASPARAAAMPPAAAASQARPAAAQASPAAQVAHPASPGEAQPGDDLFARYTRGLVAERAGQPVEILQAGCTTAGTDLGVAALRAAGAEIVVTLIDDDQPVTRAAAAADESMAECVLGDLRTVPLPQRSHDIVLCALLVHRIRHTELVLDRLVGTLRPGGLLLLRFADRDSAAGFLDRVLPTVARRLAWRRRHPGQPGPYPAVYERLSSAKGMQSYVPMRGLVIAERRALGGRGGTLATPAVVRAAQALVARLSRGRLTDAHEELLYVLRKPEDRFARVL
jgi:SAM-dependent methyltransferase